MPVLSEDSKQCEYLLLGNTHPNLQLTVLDQIQSNPFVILDTFKLYMDIANNDLKKIIKFAKSKLKYFDCLINNASLFENDSLKKLFFSIKSN
mgnify:CR=1 FL=1